MVADESRAMMRGIAGKVCVVTGAGNGLGRASATRLAEEGAHVVAVDLDEDAVERVVGGLPVPGVAVAGDIAEEADVERYMDTARSTFGRVDLHHLNAGISGSAAPIIDLDVEDFDTVMRVNLRGTFLGLRAALRQYRTQGSGGAVVLTASIASLRGSADLLPYQTSKHGTLGLLRGAAVYGGPLGIRVNAVAPGIVPTDLFARIAGPAGRQDMIRRAETAPLRRPGTPEEIAGVVAFLLSDDSSFMTGEVVSADGGAAVVSTARSSGGAGAWDHAEFDRRFYPI